MSTSVLALEPRSVLRIHDHLYKVHSMTAEGMYNLICLTANDNTPLVKSEAEIARLWASNDLELMRDPAENKVSEGRQRYLDSPFTSWPRKVREHAIVKYDYVKTFVNRKVRRRTDKALRALTDIVVKEFGHAPIPTTRYRRWIREWEGMGQPAFRDVRIFAPRWHDRGKTARFHPETEHIIDEVIAEYYLCTEPKSAEEIWGEVKRRNELIDATEYPDKFKDGNVLRSPGLTTIWRRMKLVDEDVVIANQEPESWERKCKPILRGPRATRAMEYVEIDHTLVDVWLLDYKRKIPLGRPWLTLAIDRYTRMIVGFYLSFRTPNSVTVLKCLQNVCMPKDEWLKRYKDLKNPWPAMGKMMNLVTDKAREFHSDDTLGALHSLNIDLQSCPAKKPWYKARIERAIGTMMRGCAHKLPGTTMSNLVQRGERDPVKNAALDIEDFTHLLLKYIVDIYHVKPHKGLGGMSPLEKWNEAVKEHKVPWPPRKEELDNMCSITVYRKLTQQGVTIGGLRYCDDSPALYDLMHRANMPDKVKILVNPDNLSKVKIQDWNTLKYVEVKSVDPEYTEDLTFDQHDYFVRRRAAENKSRKQATVDELIQTRRESHEMMREMSRRGRRPNKKMEDILYGNAMPGGRRKSKKAAKDAPAAPKKQRKPAKVQVALKDEFTDIDTMMAGGEALGIGGDFN